MYIYIYTSLARLKKTILACAFWELLGRPNTRKQERKNELDIIDFDLDFIYTYVLIPSKT